MTETEDKLLTAMYEALICLRDGFAGTTDHLLQSRIRDVREERPDIAEATKDWFPSYQRGADGNIIIPIRVDYLKEMR